MTSQSSLARQPLTAAQMRVFNSVIELTVQYGMAPTMVEIAKECGFASPNAAACHVNTLVKKGYLKHPNGKARAIQVKSV